MSEINLNDLESGKHRSPFVVPKGYFDRFTDEFMAKLPDMPVAVAVKPTWWQRNRNFVTAACVCGFIFGVASFVVYEKRDHAATLAAQHNIDVAIDEISDYAMYDKGDMYLSLCEY